jgi:hypothetical protein
MALRIERLLHPRPYIALQDAIHFQQLIIVDAQIMLDLPPDFLASDGGSGSHRIDSTIAVIPEQRAGRGVRATEHSQMREHHRGIHRRTSVIAEQEMPERHIQGAVAAY